MEAGIYVRISQDRTGEAAGVQRQEADCRALCDRLGWTVKSVFVDNDVSAYRGKRRPSYEEMLADLETGAIQAVACWHPDRLTRRPLELERLIDVIDATGAKVATVTSGDYDLATASGKMTARILGSVARGESERMGERIRRAGEERARKGLHNGGPRLFGYTSDRRVHPEEAAVVRELVARVLAGESVRSLTLWLGEQQVATVLGGSWAQTQVRQVLSNPSIAGLRSSKGEVIGEAAWEPLIDRDTWETLQHRLSGPRVGTRPRKHLLTGVLRCGACGTGMQARPAITYRSGVARARYHCPPAPRGCLGTTIDQEAVEADLLGQMFSVLDLPAAPKREGPDVGALEARLVELAEMWAAGDLTRAEWLAARSGVEDRLRVARAAVAGTQRLSVPDLSAWPSLPFSVRRSVVEATIERVEVGPAVRGRNFYDPSRIREPKGTIVWRA